MLKKVLKHAGKNWEGDLGSFSYITLSLSHIHTYTRTKKKKMQSKAQYGRKIQVSRIINLQSLQMIFYHAIANTAIK